MAKVVLAIDAGEQLGGNLHERMRKIGQRREIILRHAHKLVVLAIAGDLNVVVLEKLESNFFVGKQTHQLEQLFRRDRAGAFLFHLRFARRANAQFKVAWL